MTHPNEDILRGLAASLVQLLDARTAAVLVVDPKRDDRGSVRLYGPALEVEDGLTSFGPALRAKTDRVRQLLAASDVVRTDDLDGLPSWSDAADLDRAPDGDGSAIAMPVHRTDHHGGPLAPIGLLVARSLQPFGKQSEVRLASTIHVARAAIEAAPLQPYCQRCTRAIMTGRGLVSFVEGTWQYGHKECFNRAETPMHWGLRMVIIDPTRYTFEAVTGTYDMSWRTTRAVGSWFRLLEELLGTEALHRSDGNIDPVRGFAVLDDDLR